MSRTLAVEITRTSDGVVRVYSDKYENSETHPDYESWPTPGNLAYQWGEGNFACDCNRALFFWRAVGENDDQDNPCGHDGYDVTIRDEAGKLVYQDKADDQNTAIDAFLEALP